MSTFVCCYKYIICNWGFISGREISDSIMTVHICPRYTDYVYLKVSSVKNRFLYEKIGLNFQFQLAFILWFYLHGSGISAIGTIPPFWNVLKHFLFVIICIKRGAIIVFRRSICQVEEEPEI